MSLVCSSSAENYQFDSLYNALRQYPVSCEFRNVLILSVLHVCSLKHDSMDTSDVKRTQEVHTQSSLGDLVPKFAVKK